MRRSTISIIAICLTLTAAICSATCGQDSTVPPNESFTFVQRSQANVRFLSLTEIDRERQKQIDEDTAILRHLIHKALPNEGSRNAMGIQDWASADAASAQYIEGLGLVLEWTVSEPVAPLSTPAETDSNQDASEESEWERARKEIADRDSVVASVYSAMQMNTGRAQWARAVAAEFDEAFGHALDQAVISALRQIGNFRALDADDSVTVLIYGPGGNPGERSVAAWRAKKSDVGSDNLVPESKVQRGQYVQEGSSIPTSGSYEYDLAR